MFSIAACFGIIAMTVNAMYGEHASGFIQLMGLSMFITAVLGVYTLQKKSVKACSSSSSFKQ